LFLALPGSITDIGQQDRVMMGQRKTGFRCDSLIPIFVTTSKSASRYIKISQPFSHYRRTC